MGGSGREALRDGGLGAAGGAVVARGERAGRGRGAGALRVRRAQDVAETERLRRAAVVTGH